MLSSRETNTGSYFFFSQMQHARVCFQKEKKKNKIEPNLFLFCFVELQSAQHRAQPLQGQHQSQFPLETPRLQVNMIRGVGSALGDPLIPFTCPLSHPIIQTMTVQPLSSDLSSLGAELHCGIYHHFKSAARKQTLLPIQKGYAALRLIIFFFFFLFSLQCLCYILQTPNGCRAVASPEPGRSRIPPVLPDFCGAHTAPHEGLGGGTLMGI